MTKEEAIEKAMKLMKLSGSDNAHESAAAIARAQQILEKFQMEIADLPDVGESEPIGETWHDTKPGSKRLDRWKLHVLGAVASANGCDVFMHGKNSCFVGQKGDATRAISMFKEIVLEVERVAFSRCRGKGITAHNSFRMGMSHMIAAEISFARERLKNEMRGRVSEKALVVIDDKAVLAKAETEKRYPAMGQIKYTGTVDDGEAFQAGARAGRGVYQKSSTTKLGE